VTGETGDKLKQRLRTGTVVTDGRPQLGAALPDSAKRFNQVARHRHRHGKRTIAAQGYRLRVPYGTLLCVSDKPLHGEIKLPGAGQPFYERAIGEHMPDRHRDVGYSPCPNPRIPRTIATRLNINHDALSLATSHGGGTIMTDATSGARGTAGQDSKRASAV
jgi:hypothetical protein